MPIRDKFKRAFGRSPSSAPSIPADYTLTPTPSTPASDVSLTLTKTHSRPLTKILSRKPKPPKPSLDPDDYPDNVYKPGEPMPKPKYRGMVDKKHQQKLETWGFGTTLEKIRRKSGVSEYSPMGSRMPSRQGSRAGEGGGVGRTSLSRVGRGIGAEGLGEVDDDDDVENVGLSRRPTHESQPLRAAGSSDGTAVGDDNTRLEHSKTVTVTMANGSSSDGTLFSEEELAKVFTKSTLKAGR